ncbi:MAG: lytic transglycosylase domain-containing protein [Proteobacteria bacterium]|nr:lytic transglycosylase domain-containing protein [Pseudomonadota bacterium]
MRSPQLSAARAIFAAILIVLPLTLSAAGGPSRDESLLAAHAAFLAGDKARLARRAADIRDHVLAPYVDFWRLRLNLEEAAPGEIKDFLARHAGTALAEQLRREWLLILGKNGQWELFREERPSLVKDDPDVACYALLAQQGGQYAPAPAAGIKPFWRTPKALPEGCAPLVDAMVQSGEITPRDLRERFRLLVQTGLLTEAKRVAERLPRDQAPQAGQIDNAAQAPVRVLERSGADLKTAAERELVIVALSRLAQNDPQLAAERWNGKLRDRFPLEDRQYVWAMLAVCGARRHLPEAVEWFREAGEMPLSNEQLVWRARIALRQENWPEVRGAIERMSPSARNEPAWIYWLGRSLFVLGERESGRALMGRIAGGHHFYGRLAGEELGMPLQIPPKEAPPTQNEIAEVASLAGLQQALALYRLGLRTEATPEWIWTVRALDDRALLAAAELARRNGIWDRAINTADRTVAAHDFTVRYLTPYRDVLSKEARARQLEEPWVFGLVRQESRFIPDARSSAGAVGLMQLLPSTARWVARKVGMRGFHLSRVSRPEVNAALGAFYLRHVLDEFNGCQILAAAAYNAGPGRAHRWRDVRPLEGAIYIETIPFAETRQYVKNVMANTVYYAAMFGGEQPSLKSRLGTIAGATFLKAGAGQ